MRRREFLKLTAAGLLASAAQSGATLGAAPATATSTDASMQFDRFFLPILRGYLINSKKTSDSWAVCDFPGGTKIKTCCNPSGNTYTSVSRMLPAIVEYAAARPAATCEIAGGNVALDDVVLSAFRCAFDPKHKDYWGEPPADRATQRSVEASLIAWTLWRGGERIVGNLSSAERRNIQRWLASCTTVPERKSNHAWFTALNQAARLELSRAWPEFSGDESWMLEDLKALDALYAADVGGADGWYSDDPELPVYDYYNFWTFANFPLYWGRVIGARYRDWNDRFAARVKLLLEKSPYFFAADGSHPLMGRSLIYRFALLSPLVLGYQQGLWPHSPGLLRRIVRGSLEYHWRIGGFDESAGKLRETYTPGGSPELREFYIDNGHPYWAMQAFTLFGIPPNDPFWHDPEQPLPVERDDFTIRFEGPRMLLVGTRASGHVRWIQSRGIGRRDTYRDKYTKFAYSSHFPFNVATDKTSVPWDQALVFRDRASGACYGRVGVTEGQLLEAKGNGARGGVRTKWWVKVGDARIDVVTTIQIDGELESRAHEITAPDGIVNAGFELIEGSSALGLSESEKFEREELRGATILRGRTSGYAVASQHAAEGTTISIAESFSKGGRTNVNVVHPRMAIITAIMPMRATRVTLRSVHYASVRPISNTEIAESFTKLLSDAAREDR